MKDGNGAEHVDDSLFQVIQTRVRVVRDIVEDAKPERVTRGYLIGPADAVREFFKVAYSGGDLVEVPYRRVTALDVEQLRKLKAEHAEQEKLINTLMLLPDVK